MSANWRFRLSIALILCILAGCAPAVEDPAATNTPVPATSEVQRDNPPTPDPRPRDDVFPDTSEGRIPVIFSHGGAPCDIGGLVYFSKHPSVDLIGMVLSRGEIHPENALDDWSVFLYDVLNSRGTAIALGSDERMDPNSHEFPESWRVSADNFWGLALPQPATEFDVAQGPELIVELVNNSPERVTIIAMASMIDVALALQMDPGIIDNISHVVIMGGAFTIRGNLDDDPTLTGNEVAEWNMWIDAEAARYVFNSGVPMSIVPLDGIQYFVPSADVDRMNAIDDPGVNYVSQMWNQQREWFGEFLIWDMITSTAVTNPENFYWTYDGVDVITDPGDFQGQTIALQNGAQHTRYATGADYDAIMEQIFEIFQGEEQAVSTEDVSPETGTTITVLGGTWEGDTGNFHITFILQPECELNVKCGTFEIPDFSLTGDISIVNIEGNVYEFEATNLSSGEPSAALYEYLEVLDEGTLRYVTTGASSRNEAILTRK